MIVNLEIEIFVTKARITALNSRIESERDFIKRCQQRQWNTNWKAQGLVPAITYDSLAPEAKDAHRKKRKRRRKSDLWYNFFTWGQFNISPYEIIKDAENKIAKLKPKLTKLKKQLKEREANG